MTDLVDPLGDVVVTIPQGRWLQWLAEGDLPGDPPAESTRWSFYLGGGVPRSKPGARCYVVAWGRLRGYAPIVASPGPGDRSIDRAGGAVACTIPELIPGFRGFRPRSWRREDERPFADWVTAGLPPSLERDVHQLLELRARGPEWRAGLRHWALTGDTSKIPSAATAAALARRTL